MPTWRGSARVADLGVAATRRLWPGHPPIWLLTDAGSFTHRRVVRTCDASRASGARGRSDWVGVTRHGLTTLLAADQLTPTDWVLLVLDDHAPARPVDGPLVAAAIAAAEARGAPYLRLHGRADSVAAQVGTVLGRPLARVDRAWPWYHALHPAAWRVAHLLGVLDTADAAGQHDPWSFERLGHRELEHLAVLDAWPSPFGGYLHRGRVNLRATLRLRHPATHPLRRALLLAWLRETLLERPAERASRPLRALATWSASLRAALRRRP